MHTFRWHCWGIVRQTRWPLYPAGGGTHHAISCDCCHQCSGENCNVEQVSFDPHIPPHRDPHPLHCTPQIHTDLGAWPPAFHSNLSPSHLYELSLPSFLYQPPSKTTFPPNVLTSAKFRKERDLLTFFILKCRLLLSLHSRLPDFHITLHPMALLIIFLCVSHFPSLVCPSESNSNFYQLQNNEE